MLKKKCFAIFFLVLMPFFSTYAALPAVESLFKIINSRFIFMQELAAAKYSHNYPIDFAVPERIALRQIYFDADKLGFDVRTVRPFITLQVLIGKHIQENWFLFWRQHGFIKNYLPKDLQGVLIPELMRYDQQILLALAEAVPILQTPANAAEIEKLANDLITASFVSPTQKKSLVDTLEKIRMKPTK